MSLYSKYLRFVILNEVKNPVFMRVIDSSLRSVEDPGLSGNNSFSTFETAPEETIGAGRSCQLPITVFYNEDKFRCN